MAPSKNPKISFLAGEVAPQINAAIETEIYQRGLRKCENWIVDINDGILNRPGTDYIDDCYSSSVASRLIPFQFNEEQAYVLEFSNLKMRILKDGGLVGAPTVVDTDYATANLPDLNYTQSADVLYMFHGDYMIREITRTSDTAWTVTTMPRTDGPYLPREAGDEDVRINVLFVSGTTWRLTADSAIFGDVEVGEPIKLGFPVPGDLTALHWSWYLVSTVTSDTVIEADIQNDPPRPVYQQVLNPYFKNGNSSWQEITATAGAGSLSYDFTNQRAVLTDDGANDAKMEQPVLTFSNVNHRLFINIAALTGTTPSVTVKVGTASGLGDIFTSAVLTSTGPYVFSILPTQGTVYINFDTAGSGAGATVEINKVELWPIGDEPTGGTQYNTTEWRLSAWNSTHGYPKYGIVKDQRLITACTKNNPRTIWASVLGNFRSHEETTPTRASDAFSVAPGTGKINGIRWLIDKDGLKVGTAGEVWRVFAPSGGTISPLDVAIDVDASEGSLGLEPIVAHNAILMTPRGKEPVIELISSLEAKGFETRDIAAKASHLFENRRIVRWAFAKDPHSVVWVILDNGKLLSLTYHRRNGIWAWAKQKSTAGYGINGEYEEAKFMDIAVIPNSSDDNIDDVYLVVNRGGFHTGGGSFPNNYFLEILSNRITPQEAAYGLSASGSPYDYGFLDSSLTYDNPSTISGITTGVGANPMVVTDTGHPYSNGDEIRIQNVLGVLSQPVAGTSGVNNLVFVVTNKTANTYELYDTEGNPASGVFFTKYKSGGESRLMTNTLSGFSHLEGQDITVIADGVAEAGLTVSGGIVTLANKASFARGGIPFISEAETLDIETIFQTGGTQGRIKGILSEDIYFTKSRDLKVYASNRTDKVREVEFNDEAYGEDPPPLFDGIKLVDVKSDHDKAVSIVFKQESPYPVHIVRAILDVDYAG